MMSGMSGVSGMPEKRTHDYVRHGVTSLFAAFNVADGTLISSLHRRHRTVEFKTFLAKIDAEVPADLDVHLICDNYGTHKTPAIKRWLAAHPRFQMHYTPTYCSWINQVECWFAYFTEDLLRRGDHHSVQALEHDIRTYGRAVTPTGWTARCSEHGRCRAHELPVRTARLCLTSTSVSPVRSTGAASFSVTPVSCRVTVTAQSTVSVTVRFPVVSQVTVR